MLYPPRPQYVQQSVVSRKTPVGHVQATKYHRISTPIFEVLVSGRHEDHGNGRSDDQQYQMVATIEEAAYVQTTALANASSIVPDPCQTV